LEQQQFSRNAWVVGIISLFTLIFLLYRSYTQRNANRYLGDLVTTRTQEIEQKNKELQQAYSEMKAISLTDELTGLNNRRFLENHIAKDLQQWLRQLQNQLDGKTEHSKNTDIVFFMIDMDDFKAVNDTHGHSAGDVVLKQLAKRMQSVFRKSDHIVRWGDEEFVAVAKFIERTEAPVLAQRMLDMVNTTPFELTNNKTANQSCSIGYVSFPATLKTINSLHWHTFISLADACLDAAKYSGKNTWVGIQDIIDTDLPMHNISAKKLQDWYQQQVTLITSLSSPDDIKWDPS
jgi:two-component system cell cycle response regulator